MQVKRRPGKKLMERSPPIVNRSSARQDLEAEKVRALGCTGPLCAALHCAPGRGGRAVLADWRPRAQQNEEEEIHKRFFT